jgi:protein TonB
MLMISTERARALLEPDLVPPTPELIEPEAAPHSSPTTQWPEALLPRHQAVSVPDLVVPLLPELEVVQRPPEELLRAPSTAERLSAEAVVEAQTLEVVASDSEDVVSLEERGDLLVSSRLPRYPSRAQRRGIEGVVVLELRPSADGSVASVEVHRTSGSRELDRAAVEALRRWRFDTEALRAVGMDRTFRQSIRFDLVE